MNATQIPTEKKLMLFWMYWFVFNKILFQEVSSPWKDNLSHAGFGWLLDAVGLKKKKVEKNNFSFKFTS